MPAITGNDKSETPAHPSWLTSAALLPRQMGYIRAHELRLRQDVPTGETPQKRELPLPTALPAFRSDDQVIAEFRCFGGARVRFLAPCDEVGST
jgi:hypothetical protein